jgi:hypothetical protein
VIEIFYYDHRPNTSIGRRDVIRTSAMIGPKNLMISRPLPKGAECNHCVPAGCRRQR